MIGSCTLETVVLPIKDVQVNSTVPDSLMKGIPARIGTPEQDIVLLPWPYVGFSRLLILFLLTRLTENSIIHGFMTRKHFAIPR